MLAEQLAVSKGYLSKIETGKQRPSVYFARVADTVLEAGGKLLDLTGSHADTR